MLTKYDTEVYETEIVPYNGLLGIINCLSDPKIVPHMDNFTIFDIHAIKLQVRLYVFTERPRLWRLFIFELGNEKS